jgi:predicted phosphate transport protein (TIGR00153 family)
MFGRFMPTEGKFFEYFNQHADCAVTAAHELEALVNDLPNAEAHARRVQATEKKADRVTHDTIDLLHKTFITPLDRDEIHKLITTMDDILDLMEDVAETISLYDVTSLTDEARRLAAICVQCCDQVKIAVALLEDMGNASAILKTTQQIDQLESEADRVMRSAMSKLFREETDVKRLIKLKAIYEQLESIPTSARTWPTSSKASSWKTPEARTRMHTVQMSLWVIGLLVALALLFDFMNGFHDAANSIATVVSTGVLKPHHAVAMAAMCNVIAIFIFHLKVAATVGTGTIDVNIVDHYVIFGALVGAIAWNVITWLYGIPSSSSHALIGLVGAAVAKAGTGALVGNGLLKTVAFILISPLLGFILGSIMMVIVGWTFFRTPPSRVDRWFRRLQLVSASLYSLGHGGNDAQKTIGIIWMLLIASGHVGGWRRAADVGDRELLPGHRHGHAVRRLADRAHDGSEDHQAEAGGRLLRGDRRCDHAVHCFRAGCAGVDHTHDHRRDRRRGLGAEDVGRALGRGGQHRVGLGPDDSGLGIYVRHCLVDRQADSVTLASASGIP